MHQSEIGCVQEVVTEQKKGFINIGASKDPLRISLRTSIGDI
jgi:hypothetical protein